MSSNGSSLSAADIDAGAASGLTPTRTLWVSASAAAGGDGSAERPYSTIQAAVNIATPGTAVMVQAGTYVENVKFISSTGGTADAPIQLISANGQGAAKVVAADNSISTVKGLGVHDVVVKGFDIQGGLNGIQFSQSGSDFTHLVSNIVVQGNIISNTVQDGVKISQAEGVRILDNTIAHTGGEGVDFVAVNNSIIARNDVSFAQGAAGIFTKGGSTNDLVSANTVHDILKDGIEIGGWTTEAYFRPGFDAYEAKDITVEGNTVTGVGQRPVNLLGALHSEVVGNQLTANSSYLTAIEIGSGANKAMVSSKIAISGNVIANAPATLYAVDPGSSAVDFHDNAASGGLGLNGGPSASWLSAEALFVATAVGGAVPTPVQASSAPAPVVSGVSIYNGASASETLVGTGLHNALYGGGGNDSLIAGASDDTLDGGLGVDTMVGGSGTDVYVVSSNSDSIMELPGGGIDTVYTTLTTVRLPWANVENAVFTGNASANIVGNELDNSLIGGAFNDSMDGGTGADTLVGGLGDDLYFVHDGRTQIVEAAGGGTDTAKSDVSFVLAANVENLLLVNPGLTGVGNELDNKITGTAGGDAMYGGAGNDTLLGNDGADTLDGGIGADSMLGGKGDDVYYVDDPGDMTLENANDGADTVYTSLQTCTLANNIETLIGVRDGGQELTGNLLSNLIIGSDYNDTLHGGGGADTLAGGLGDDTYYVEDAREQVQENPGEGYDTVIVANGAWAPAAGSEIELIVAVAGASAIALHGNEFSQRLVGNAGANVIDGGAGADTLVGGAGNDTYIVNDARNMVVEGANEGVDLVQAKVSFALSDNVENLTLTGVSLQGEGNGLANLITGGSGNDTLVGRGGADTLSGAGGADVFVYRHGADGGDLILDFQPGVDKLNVQALMAELGPVASISYTHVAAGLNVYVDHDGAHDLLALLQGVSGSSLGSDSFDWSVIPVLDSSPPSSSGGGGSPAAVISSSPASPPVVTTLATGGTSVELTSASQAPSQAPASVNGFHSGLDKIDLSAVAPTSINILGVGEAYFAFVGTAQGPMQIVVQGDPLQPGDFVTGSSSLGFGFIGSANAETVVGSSALDALNGGDGNDVLIGGGNGDVLTGGAGADIFRYLRATDSTAQSGDTITDFQTGVDKIDLTAVHATSVNIVMTGGASFLFVPTLSGVAMQIGVTGQVGVDDLITGNSTLGVNVLGSIAPETITGGANLDALNGGGGDDVLIGGGHGDVLTGGAGADIFRYLTATDSNAASYDVITDFQTGVDKIDLAATGLGALNIVQQGGASFLFAQTATGAMQIAATGAVNGTDITGLNQGVAISVGDGVAHAMVGSALGDTLSGGAGADTLIGGGGADLMAGGAGADTFQFVTYVDSTVAAPDTITDFQPGVDHLDISALHTAGSTFGFMESNGSTLVFIDRGGDGVNDAMIVLRDTVNVHTTDFIW